MKCLVMKTIFSLSDRLSPGLYLILFFFPRKIFITRSCLEHISSAFFTPFQNGDNLDPPHSGILETSFIAIAVVPFGLLNLFTQASSILFLRTRNIQIS